MSIQKFIKDVCKQTAVYWEPDKTDRYGGKCFKKAVEIKVRWDHKEGIKITPEGKEIHVRSELLTPVDLKYEGRVWLGKLGNFDGKLLGDDNKTPVFPLDTYEIKYFEKIPMIFSTKVFVRKAYLSSLGG